MERIAHTEAPAPSDGEQATRIRPDPLPAPAPAQAEPSKIAERKPEPSGHRAPDIRVSSDGAVGPNNLVLFPAPDRTARRGRKKKEGEATLRVEHVKPSKGTWAFRIRWTDADGNRPVVYVSRVNDQLFKSITGSKTTYAAFKKQLISSYLSRAVRQGDGTLSSSNRPV